MPLKMLKVFEKNDVIKRFELVIAVSEPVGKSYWHISLKRTPFKLIRWGIIAPHALQHVTTVTLPLHHW